MLNRQAMCQSMDTVSDLTTMVPLCQMKAEGLPVKLKWFDYIDETIGCCRFLEEAIHGT